MMCPRRRAFTRHPIRWRGWRRGWTSSCTQHSTPSWGQTGTAECRRQSFIARVWPPIYRSWRDGAAGGSEVPYAHSPWPIAWHYDTQSLEGSWRSVDRGGLPQGGRGWWVYRKYNCGRRSCNAEDSDEVREPSPSHARDSAQAHSRLWHTCSVRGVAAIWSAL